MQYHVWSLDVKTIIQVFCAQIVVKRNASPLGVRSINSLDAELKNKSVHIENARSCDKNLFGLRPELLRSMLRSTPQQGHEMVMTIGLPPIVVVILLA